MTTNKLSNDIEIIEKIKELHKENPTKDIKELTQQALNEFVDPRYLNDNYLIFDITSDDIINSIATKLTEDINNG